MQTLCTTLANDVLNHSLQSHSDYVHNSKCYYYYYKIYLPAISWFKATLNGWTVTFRCKILMLPWNFTFRYENKSTLLLLGLFYPIWQYMQVCNSVSIIMEFRDAATFLVINSFWKEMDKHLYRMLSNMLRVVIHTSHY